MPPLFAVLLPACPGTLTQWLAEHRAGGGEDPHTLSRRNLLESGAPLACSKARKAASRPASGFFMFRSRMIAQRKLSNHRLSKAEAKQEEERLQSELRALSPSQRSEYTKQASDAHLRKKASADNVDKTAAEPSAPLTRDVLFSLNDVTFP